MVRKSPKIGSGLTHLRYGKNKTIAEAVVKGTMVVDDVGKEFGDLLL